MPFTRNCLKHKKVRLEIGEQGEAKSAELEDLQDQYDHLVTLTRRREFNACVFDASIPVAKRMERVVDEEEQVKQLLETKSAFSVGGFGTSVELGLQMPMSFYVLRNNRLPSRQRKVQCRRRVELCDVSNY